MAELYFRVKDQYRVPRRSVNVCVRYFDSNSVDCRIKRYAVTVHRWLDTEDNK